MAHDFGNGDGGIPAPEPVAGAARAKAGLPHKANAQFKYAVHPLRWDRIQTDKGIEYLPSLSKRPIVNGVAGTDGRGNSTIMEVELQNQGWRVLPQNLVPAGFSPTNEYIQAFPCRNGKYHCAAWERPRHIGGRPMSDAVDMEKHLEWRRWLVSEGHVPQIDPAIKARLDQKARSRAAKRGEAFTEADAKPTSKGKATSKAKEES